MLASTYRILSPDVCNIVYCIAINVASLIGIAVYQFRQYNYRHSLVKSGYDIQNRDMLMKVIVLQPQPQTVNCKVRDECIQARANIHNTCELSVVPS